MAETKAQSIHHVTDRKDRIPVFQKIVYGIGSFVNQFQAAAVGQLIAVLNLGLGVNPALVGWIGAVPRFIDAFSDPLIGYSSDNTRSRYGRRRPWIFFGAIASGILLALMFQLYKGRSENFYFWYVLSIQILFVIAFACYSIPWIALGYEMTPDYHERTRLQAFANVFSQPVWMIAPWFFSIMSSKVLELKIGKYTLATLPGFTDIVHGARVLAIIVGGFILIGGILPAIFNKEHFVNLPPPEKKKGAANVIKDLMRNCVLSFQCLPFVKLCAVTFLIFNGFMLASAFTAYVFFFYVYGGSQAANGLSAMDNMWHSGGVLLGMFGMISSICTLGAISLTAWISSKIGKKKAFLITMSLATLGYALKWVGYNPQHPYLILIAAPFLAFHLGALFTIVPSMVADVCDYDELQNGARREGMFSGIYWWIQKLGMAGASVLGGYLLNWIGFNIALGLGQSTHTLLYMRLCDVGIPIGTTVIAIFIIMTFEVSEDKAYEIRKQLEARRGKA
ncbi:MAG: MFS transporter [Candidatus Omnitrophica bacterium]|nr:MFS transporter [Candidatus Omnitrophota bacterium]